MMPAGGRLTRRLGIQARKGEQERMSLNNYVLDKEDAVLLIVDVQERLAVVMKERERVVANCRHLIALAGMLDIPIVVTEQYPKGLGRTVAELRSDIPQYAPMEKTAFNCCGESAFMPELRRLGRNTIIMTGMETHICVLQTTVGLLQEGYGVHVVEDAVCSRAEANWKTGIAYLRDAGATVTCTETALFQLLKVAGTEAFKKISQRVK